jgi:hypothetical protein
MLSDVCLLVVKQAKKIKNKFTSDITLNNYINNSLQIEIIRNRRNFQQRIRLPVNGLVKRNCSSQGLIP